MLTTLQIDSAGFRHSACPTSRRWGGAGCGLATAVVLWVSASNGALLLNSDRFYERFALRGLGRRRAAAIGEPLRLGLPIGATCLIDVGAFNMVTLLSARFGTAVVGGHVIVANLGAVTYMLPMSIATAASVLAAHALGSGDLRAARRVASHGVRLAAVLGVTVAAALVLLVAAYHVADAVQVARVRAARLGSIGLADDRVRGVRSRCASGAWASAAACCSRSARAGELRDSGPRRRRRLRSPLLRWRRCSHGCHEHRSEAAAGAMAALARVYP